MPNNQRRHEEEDRTKNLQNIPLLNMADEDYKNWIRNQAAGIYKYLQANPGAFEYSGPRVAPLTPEQDAALQRAVARLPKAQRDYIHDQRITKAREQKARDLRVRYDREHHDLLERIKNTLLESSEGKLDAVKDKVKQAKSPDEIERILNGRAPFVSAFYQPGTRGYLEEEKAHNASAPAGVPGHLSSVPFLRKLVEDEKRSIFERSPELQYLDPQLSELARRGLSGKTSGEDNAWFVRMLDPKSGMPQWAREELWNNLDIQEKRPLNVYDPQFEDMRKRASDKAAKTFKDPGEERTKLEQKIIEDEAKSFWNNPVTKKPLLLSEHLKGRNLSLPLIQEMHKADPSNTLGAAPRLMKPHQEFLQNLEGKPFSWDEPDSEGLFENSGSQVSPDLSRASNIDASKAIDPFLGASQQRLTESDAYRDAMMNPVLSDAIKDMTARAKEHYLREIVPSINGRFIAKGAYHTSARQEAMRHAAERHQELLDRGMREMMFNQHNSAIKSAEAQRRHLLELAQTKGQSLGQDRAGLISVAHAKSEEERRAEAIEAARTAALYGAGQTNQQLEQKRIAAQIEQAQTQQAQAFGNLSNMNAITSNLPQAPTGMAAISLAAQPAPVNWPAAVGGMLQNFAPQQHAARGGPIRHRAMGGPLPQPQPQQSNELAIFNTPEMQQLRAYQGNYSGARDREDPSWRYVRRVGAQLLQTPRGGSPLQAVGKGMEQADDDFDTINKEHRTNAINIAGRIQEARLKHYEIERDFEKGMKVLDETRRHNRTVEGETFRHNRISETVTGDTKRQASEAKERKERLNKLKPTSADTALEKKLSDDERILERQQAHLDTLKRTADLPGGTFVENLPVLGDMPFIQGLAHADLGRLADYGARHTAYTDYAMNNANLRGTRPGAQAQANEISAKGRPAYGPEFQAEFEAKERPFITGRQSQIAFVKDAKLYGLPPTAAAALYPHWKELKKENPNASRKEFYRQAYEMLTEGTMDLPDLGDGDAAYEALNRPEAPSSSAKGPSMNPFADRSTDDLMARLKELEG